MRFLHNATVKHRAEHRRTGPLIAEEITTAKSHWIKREQRNIPPGLKTSGFELSGEEGTGFLKCKGTSQRFSKAECLWKNSYGIHTSKSYT